jgi:hypothetical protein
MERAKEASNAGLLKIFIEVYHLVELGVAVQKRIIRWSKQRHILCGVLIMLCRIKFTSGLNWNGFHSHVIWKFSSPGAFAL